MENDYIQFGAEPTYILQPDYQLGHNGYGLMQLTANYAIDIASAGSSTDKFRRGADFVSGSGPLDMALYTYPWTCVRAEEKGRDGQVAYITAHYAAIRQGSYTETEASLTSSVVSEPIESHPNFTKVQVPGIGDGVHNLGGNWLAGKPPLKADDTVNNPYRAIWGPITTSIAGGTITYNFLGFAANDSNQPANRKAGVRNWMRPTFTLRLTAYTDNADEAASTCSYIGFIATKKVGNVLEIPQVYEGIGESGLLIKPSDVSATPMHGKRDWLIVGANMEVYGGLYKVTADLLLSGVLGWDPDIYPRLTAEGYFKS